jgi:nickel transport protein
MKKIIYWTVPLVALFLICNLALAHKVNLFAYVEGGTVFTESYFPDGRAVEGGKVKVYDSQNNLLLEGVTDKEGLFNFKIPKIDDLTIVLDATMGHKASFKLKKDEVEAGK